MQRLGKNHGGYFGETIDVRGLIGEFEAAARAHGWRVETFLELEGFNFLALHRRADVKESPHVNLYLSAGIHGDEPAAPLAALRLLKEYQWPARANVWLCPCLNPVGFSLNRRENREGKDLNRDYLHLETNEVRAHVEWLKRQPGFDLSLCLHEDWESHGFYVYELNPDGRVPLAESIVRSVSQVCPIDMSDVIEDREAKGGIIRPNVDPRSRPQWPEAFWLLQNKTRQSCTLEAPSDFPLDTRVNALVAGVQGALGAWLKSFSQPG